MTLDRSHYRCPLPATAPSGIGDQIDSPVSTTRKRSIDARPVDRTEPKDLCFQTCPRRDAVKLPVTEPCLRAIRLARTDTTATSGCIGPSARTASASSRMPRGPNRQIGYIPSSRCRTTRSGQRRERCAGRTDQRRIPDCADGLEAPVAVDRPFRSEAIAQGDGGARRDRTDDLMLAKHALSQLSYCPVQ